MLRVGIRNVREEYARGVAGPSHLQLHGALSLMNLPRRDDLPAGLRQHASIRQGGQTNGTLIGAARRGLSLFIRSGSLEKVALGRALTIVGKFDAVHDPIHKRYLRGRRKKKRKENPEKSRRAVLSSFSRTFLAGCRCVDESALND